MNATTRIPFTLLAVLTTLTWTSSAHASGGVTHESIAQMAIPKLGNADLRNVLTQQRDSFRVGVIHPDVWYGMEQVMPGHNITDGHPDLREAGHLLVNKADNYLATFTKNLERDCPDLDALSVDCANRIAFLFGVLTHVVTDANFDTWFVDKYGAGTGVVAKCKFAPDPAEHFTDKDLDFCLSRGLNPSMDVGFLDVLFAKHKPMSVVAGQGYSQCPAGATYDGLTGWCYACPSGTTLARSVNASNPCKGGEQLQSANWSGNLLVGNVCPAGTFWDGYVKEPQFGWAIGSCWSCPNNSIRTGYPVYSGQACDGTEYYGLSIKEAPTTCAGVGGTWDFSNSTCLRCPSGYLRTLDSATSATACRRTTMTPLCSLIDIKNIGFVGVPLPVIHSGGYYDYPLTSVVSAYESSSEPAMPPNSSIVLGTDLDVTTRAMILGYTAEPSMPASTYEKMPGNPAELMIDNCEWAVTNLRSSRGGLDDSSSNAAKFLDNFWNMLRHQRSTPSSGDLSIVRTTTTTYTVSLAGMPTFDNK